MFVLYWLVTWEGYQDNMVKVFTNSHVICFPSYREGLPKALIEAASCGRPIVAYDVPGSKEVVKNGVNGFLVPLNDVNAMVKALGTLYLNSNLRKEMGVAGRNIVLKFFEQEYVVNKTLQVYKSIYLQGK
jgi:glycosyltransferase involved in cell wall biosynthesis